MDAREKIETVLGEIRSSLSEFRTIINTIPALAWSSRPDCSVDFVDKRWEEYTGLSSEQSYGEGWQAASAYSVGRYQRCATPRLSTL